MFLLILFCPVCCISTLTFDKYVIASKNYVMADNQPGTWLHKVDTSYNSRSKSTGNSFFSFYQYLYTRVPFS